MSDTRPLFVGFSSASKVAREGGDVEVIVETAEGPRAFTLPWFFVRDVDALLERWRRDEHEAVLLCMNGGLLGRTLCEAAEAGGLLDLRFLLARGADVNTQRGAWSALMLAASNGHLPVLRALLDADAEGLEIALLWAATSGRTAAAALLLDRGADIHWASDAALRIAARWSVRGLEMVRFLLDSGADVHACSDEATRYARKHGHSAMLALLLERGAAVGED